jgi:hypothetical protein
MQTYITSNYPTLLYTSVVTWCMHTIMQELHMFCLSIYFYIKLVLYAQVCNNTVIASNCKHIVYFCIRKLDAEVCKSCIYFSC